MNHTQLHDLFFKVAKAYTKQKFQLYLKELTKMSAKIGMFLTEDVPLENWAALYGNHNRRKAMTLNIVELMNARSKKTMDMLVMASMEQVRALCQQWSVKFQTKAMNTVTLLAIKYYKIIFKRLIKSASYTVISFPICIFGSLFTIKIDSYCS